MTESFPSVTPSSATLTPAAVVSDSQPMCVATVDACHDPKRPYLVLLFANLSGLDLARLRRHYAVASRSGEPFTIDGYPDSQWCYATTPSTADGTMTIKLVGVMQ